MFFWPFFKKYKKAAFLANVLMPSSINGALKQLISICDFLLTMSKDLPNMNTFYDWLSETIVISVYDSFFRNYISIVLLSYIVLTSQSQRLFT